MSDFTPNKALLAFIATLPVGHCYTPIYRSGQVFGKDNQHTSKGKSPHERSWHQVFSPSDVAYHLEHDPGRYSAIGLFTGIRSGGLVILDVDANLTALKKKWGDSLNDAPCVVSTKKNAAKYVFRVPKEQWAQVKGKTLEQGNTRCYEILWGMQGVIAGEYPGSSDGKYPQGTYTLKAGSFNSIPEAPEWLLAEMRERFQQERPQLGLVKNRKGLDFSGRTQDEVAEIVHECLSVLPHLGRGSEDQWWRIGAMVAEALPNDLGLTLWAAWSAQDPAYEEDWAQGKNPCQERWEYIVRKAGRAGNMGLGSLIKLADDYDPDRLRFQESTKKTIDEVEASQGAGGTPLGFDQLIERARTILGLDNPAEVNYRMHQLACEAGFRDKSYLEQLLVDQMQHEQQAGTLSLSDLLNKDYKRDYIIPDLLPRPGVVLLYGAGGDGKSMTSWTIAKHIATGEPFIVHGGAVPVEQGSVLILNGDQALVQLQEQLREIDMPDNAPVTIRTDWSLYYYARFVQLIEQVQPKLVVIDSLIGCSGGKAFDENKSDFATPLYWLTKNNGVLFPATTILIVHHANKNGGFRGTSAIRDAVDEVWALHRPDERQQQVLGPNTRILVIEKSRAGRSGTELVLRQRDDLTYSLAEEGVPGGSGDATPSGVGGRVLQRLRTASPGSMTHSELCADPLCGGSVVAIRKALARLRSRGLISISATTPSSKGGKPVNHYQAICAASRGDRLYSCPIGEKPSDTNGLAMGQPMGQPMGQGGELSHWSEPEQWDKQDVVPLGCPIANPSDTKGSAPMGQETDGIRAREAKNQPSGPSQAEPLGRETHASSYEGDDADYQAASDALRNSSNHWSA